MKVSDKGITLIKKYEGLRLNAYQDSVGVWTIGYGSTGPHVFKGKVITEAEANSLLLADISRFEKCVSNAVTVKITQNQFDALISFAFNLGCGNLLSSTLLLKLNNGDKIGAAAEFKRWNKAGGKVLNGLTLRREEEASLFAQG